MGLDVGSGVEGIDIAQCSEMYRIGIMKNECATGRICSRDNALYDRIPASWVKNGIINCCDEINFVYHSEPPPEDGQHQHNPVQNSIKPCGNGSIDAVTTQAFFGRYWSVLALDASCDNEIS